MEKIKKTRSNATAYAAAINPQKTSAIKPTGSNIGKLHIFILVAIFFIAYINIFDEKVDLNGDNICYFILGKALATGHGYTNIHTPLMSPHNHFPPGYPFIISLFMRLGFDSISFYNMLNGIFGILSIIIFYGYMIKTGLERTLSFVICLFIMLNSNMLLYFTINMSEVPFMFFSLIVLYLLVSINYKKKFYADPSFLLMLACLIAAYYIRTTGVTLLFAVLTFFIYKKKWMYAFSSLAVFIVGIIPWQIRTSRLGGNDYIHQLLLKSPYAPDLGQAGIKDFATRMLQNVIRYITTELPTGLVIGNFSAKEDTISHAASWAIGITLLLLIIYGMIRLIKQQPAMVAYIIATGGALLLWPSAWFGIRFMMPVIPILIMLVLYSLDNLLSYPLKKMNVIWSPYMLCILLLLMTKQLRGLKERSQASYPQQFQNYFDMATWASANIPPNSIVCTRKPEFFYIFGNRRCTNYINTKNDTLLLNDLQQQGVHYVLVDNLGFSSTGKYLVPAIEKSPNRFKLLHQVKNPDTYLFRFD